MAVPSTPTAFEVYYIQNYIAYYCDITAGDSTHTGFYVYREDDSIWTNVAEITTTNSSVVEEFLGYDLSDSQKNHRVSAFNEDGESGFLTWSYTPPPETATPTNLQFTRDNLNVTVTWDGTLESGDSWKVRLIDPGGYNDTITTVTGNTETLLTGRWVDRTVQVYPTNTPANVASITITKSIPTHTAVTNLAAVLPYSSGGIDDYSITFTCDWLQTAFDDQVLRSYYGLPTVRVFYSISGDDSNQVEVVNDLGANEFESYLNLPTPAEGQFYLFTVEVESTEATSPRPPHVSTNVIEATLTALELLHTYQMNYDSLGNFQRPTDTISISITRTSGVFNAEFESKIDNSEWIPLIAGDVENTLGIHNDYRYPPGTTAYEQCADYLGNNLLDHTHHYKYSDGFDYDEWSEDTTDDWYPHRNLRLHTIQVRGRIVGETEWITTEAVQSPLRSVWNLDEGRVYPLQERTLGYGRWYHAYLTYSYTSHEDYPLVMLPEFKYHDEGLANLSEIRSYVQDKTRQEVFTIDGGVVGPDLTDLQVGPQLWTSDASSELNVSYTKDKPIAGILHTLGNTNCWKSTATYNRYGKPSTVAWWECDLGASQAIMGFQYAGNPQANNIRVYGSNTGAFAGEEVLIGRNANPFTALSYLYKSYVFTQDHTVRYLRLYFDGLDFEIQLTSNLSVILYDVRFYFGSLIYNQDWVDIETQDWSLHWLSAVPREKLDGQSHTIQFKTIIRNVDNSVWATANSAILTVTLPSQASIALPGTHLNISRTA